METTRGYNSPVRDEQANATRRAILSVAERLFAEHGFAAVTMQQIAREAGVSLATVYLYFAGKAALVGALADEITAAPDLSVERVERELDPVTALRIGAGIIRQLNERSWVVADILRSAHGTNDVLGETWALWQGRHLAAVGRAVAALSTLGALRPGLDVAEATDGLYALAGTDLYRALVGERGWSPERYERWLFEVAVRELLGLSTE